jgi:capsular polysaccharide biosynthesis protein
VIGNKVYGRNLVTVRNTHVQIIKRDYHSILERCIRYFNHTHRPVRKVSGSYYFFYFDNDNLGHFFHDIFFPFYVEWKKNPLPVLININKNQFQLDFLESVLGKKNIHIIDHNYVYEVDKIIVSKEHRDLKDYENYLDICREIRSICFEKNSINVDRKNSYLYGRSELKRKRLLKIEPTFLETLGISEVFLSKLSFKEVLEILGSAKIFIYVVGAGVFNLLFLDESVKVLEINPVRDNSWARMFGLSNMCQFKIFISEQTCPSDFATQAEPELDNHIIFNHALKNEIEKFVRK